ncbi:MAG: tetratricopeptide repeat protein [Halothiobacillaceae bacterium]
MSLIYEAIRSAEEEGDRPALPPLPGGAARAAGVARRRRAWLGGGMIALALGVTGSLLAFATDRAADPAGEPAAVESTRPILGEGASSATMSGSVASASETGDIEAADQELSSAADSRLPEGAEHLVAQAPSIEVKQDPGTSRGEMADVSEADAPQRISGQETAGSSGASAETGKVHVEIAPDEAPVPLEDPAAEEAVIEITRETTRDRQSAEDDRASAPPPAAGPADRQRIAQWVEVTRVGDLEAARSALANLQANLPGPSLTRLRAQAWVAFRGGDHEQAERLYRELLSRVPEDREARANLELLAKIRQQRP